MLKKINNYLLVNYPLIWNTRIIQVLSFMVICHLVFFVLGYNSLSSLRSLYDYRFRYFDNLEINLVAVLIIAIVFILWLIFYLRNNPFKSFYPITKWYLVKEFFIILTTVFLTLPLYNSYTYGKHLKILKLGKNTNPEMDIQVVHQAKCFIPTDFNSYEKEQCCDSIMARERRELLKSEKNKVNENRCSNYIDFEDELTTAIPSPLDSLPPKEYSYLYYCSNESHYNYQYEDGGVITEEITKLTSNTYKSTNYYINNNNKRWLINKQKDSIQLALDKLLKVCSIYEIKHNVSSKMLTDWCFANSKLEPYNLINSNDYNEEYDRSTMYKDGIEEAKSDYYLELSNLSTGIEKVKQEKGKGFFDQVNWLIYIYFALGISIFVFMFRVTRLKPWLIAIVGSGIVGIIFAIIGQMTRGDFMLYFYFFFIVITAIMAIYWIKNDKRKMASGIGLNWFAYLMGIFLMVIAAIIIQNTDEIRECINNYWVIVRPEMPIHKWLKENMETNLQYINIVFILLMMVFVIIPLAYKWQANKAE